MKPISFVVTAVALTLSAAALSLGQTRTAATAVMPSVTVEIAEQPDSPLNLSIDEKLAPQMMGAPLKLTNTSASSVSAFVLLIKTGKYEESDMVFVLKGIAPAAYHIQGVSMQGMPQAAGNRVVSVDYVQFDDGRSWGADSLGKAKSVHAYLDARALAISRLKELLAGQDDTDFMRAIDIFRSSSYSENVPLAGRQPRPGTDFTAKGYEDILSILRRMPKRSDEAKELARKLELMQLQ